MSRALFRYAVALLPLLLAALLAAPALAQVDTDGDGVADDIDLCPAENASFFDGDGDGCLDATANARHTEFWAPGDLPLRYVIHQNGAPIITDGSDFTAVQAGYTAWTVLPGVQLSAQYLGTTASANASGTDGVHQVTFEDPDFLAVYGNAVLAVGITTSFTVPSEFDGRPVRPGQIVDADMLFNPNRTFSTPTGGTGPDLQSVATHEAGHLFGFAHSCVVSSTMFPALPGGAAARSLEAEDVVLAFMGYPDAAELATATALSGTVTNGDGGLPIPGAAVFAIAVASGDTLGCQYTLPDGGYAFFGLPAGDYYVAVHPLDGGLGINGVVPGLINALVDTTAFARFVPESWDLAESAADDGEARDPVTLSAGVPVTGIDIVTNVDATGPSIVDLTPADATTGLRADGVFVIEFDEAIDFGSAQNAFRFDRITTSGPEGVGGSLVLISEGTRLVFDPSGLLAYDGTYRLTIAGGVTDEFGNPMGADREFTFGIESAPPLHIDTAAPSFIAPGALVVIAGVSFDLSDPAANAVDFGGFTRFAETVTATSLVVRAPEEVPLGSFTLTVSTPGGGTSNALTVTGITGSETARSTPFGEVDLAATPAAVALLPDGRFAYAATDAGLASIVTDPSLADFLVATSITLAGGADDVAVTPDGARTYAVCRAAGRLVIVNSDYDDAENRNPLFNTVLDEIDLGAEPLGLAVTPDGRRVFVATAEGDVLAWDVLPASATYNTLVGEIDLGATPSGRLVVDPTGSRLLVLLSTGRIASFDAETLAPVGDAATGADPRDVAMDPQGNLVYVSRGAGDVAVLSLSGLQSLASVPVAGAPRGLAVSPAGGLGYVTNRSLDRLEVVNLDGSSPGYLSVGATFATGPDPVAAAVAPDGQLVFVAEEGTARLSVLGVGFGPIITGITPTRGRPGDMVVLTGVFAAADTSFPGFTTAVWIDFDGQMVSIAPPEDEPYSSTGSQLWVRVPAGYDGGPIRAANSGPAIIGMPTSFYSNPVNFLPTDPPANELNQAVFLGQANGYPWGDVGVRQVLATAPTNDLLAVVGLTNTIYLVDTDPFSATYGRVRATIPLTSQIGLRGLAFAPDGRRLFAVTGLQEVSVFDTDFTAGTPGALLGTVDFTALGPEPFSTGGITMHPSGELLIVENATNDGLVFVDTRPDNQDGYLYVIGNTGPIGFAVDVAVHPSGKYAYMAATTGLIHIIGLDQFSPTYLQQVGTFGLVTEATPRTLAVSPDGRRVYIVTRNFGGVGDHVLIAYDTTNPTAPTWVATATLAVNTAPDDCILRVSPAGDRAFCDIPSVGGLWLDITDATLATNEPQLGLIGLNGTGDRLAVAFTADGRRMVTASRGDTGVNLVEFYDAPKLDSLTGNNQVGVAGQPLAAPVRLRLASSDTGLPLAGATGEVSVAGGGGTLGDGSSYRLMATDADGWLDIDWTLGPAADADPTDPANRLRVTFYSQFSVVDGIVAVAVADPESLPLSLAQVLPADLTANVTITTTAQATFSRAVDRATITSSTLLLRPLGDTTPVPAVFGFADGDRRVSIIPIAPLASATTYELVVGPGILDAAGGALANPGVTTFTTRAPDAPAITAVSPPAAPVGAEIVISGQGFSAVPAENTIFFNDLPVTPVAAQVNAVRAVVPLGAVSGAVSVTTGALSTTEEAFNVLVGTDSPLNEVVETTQTGVPVRSIAVTPDGATAYAVSPETDQVIPIDLNTLAVLPGIPVGDNPVAIVMHPNGGTAYVANFGSGTVSVIGVMANAVVATINVGNEPVDLVASPAGDRLYVVNSLDQTLSIVDIDPSHATYHTVTATIVTGASTKGAAVTPDGTLLYLGTADGFIVIDLDPQSYGVVASVLTGKSTKGTTVSPDGTLLVLVTEAGEILIVDITPNGGNAVVASVLTGKTTKGATVSPDGTLLYVLLEDSDDVLVYSIDVTAPVSVIDPADGLGGLLVRLTLVDTISAGNDPLVLVFDPTGSGLALVANGGAGTITFLNASEVPFDFVRAELRMEPRTLNLESNGMLVKAVLVFPPAISPRNVDLSTVLLQGQIPPDPTRVFYEDRDQDGVEELVLKFDRALFQELLPQGDRVPCRVTGRLTIPDRAFAGDDTIRTLRPTVTFPRGGEMLMAGLQTAVTWISPERQVVTSVSVSFTTDGGATWEPIAVHVPDTGSVPWTVPNAASDRCRVIVTLFNSLGEEKSSGLSAAPFTILQTPVGVSFAGIDVRADDGDGLLAWSLAAPADIDGFHVLRATAADGDYERLTVAPVVAGAGASFEFRDTGVIAGQDYFYRLEEVRAAAPGAQHGPFALRFETCNALDQNFPNAFNPQTTIRFSIAREARTRLTIYDVAGRRVRTLIDGVLKPDVYRVQWDGAGDHGGPAASGVYLYKLETDGFSDARKMMLVR